MENFLIKNKKSFLILFGNLILTCLILMFLDYLKVITVDKFLNKELLFASIGSLLVLSVFIGLIKQKNKVLFYYKNSLFILVVSSSILVILNNYLIHKSIIDGIVNLFLVLSSIQFILLFLFERQEISNKLEDEISKNKKNSTLTILIVTTILLSIAIRIPYMPLSFTGEHTMKYNSYVEPAKYMHENNNPFLYQKKYLSDPIKNPDGIFYTFDHLPIMEWGLLGTYKLLPFFSIEINTRIFTTVIWIFVIVLSFIFFSKWVGCKIGGIIAVIMCFNPIISLASFVPICDFSALLFMFASFIFLNKYIENSKFKNFFLSSFFAGLGFVTKLSLILWMVPMLFLLMFYKEKSVIGSLRKMSVFFLFFVITCLSFYSSINILPTDSRIGLILLLVWVVSIFFVYFKVKKYSNFIESLSEKLFRNKLFYIILIAMGLIFYLLIKQKYLNEFLTDPSIVFNLELYKNLIFINLQKYLTQKIFYISLLGFFVIIFLKKNKTIKNIQLLFFIGSAIYLVVASKSIFFHNYYNIIIIITLIISTAVAIFALTTFFNSYLLKSIMFFGVVLMVTPQMIHGTEVIISKQKNGFNEAAIYLLENTKNNDLYIDDGYTLSLTLKTGRGTIGSYNYLFSDDFKISVKNIGFAETMQRYNIKYLITTNEAPDYLKISPIFMDGHYGDRGNYDRNKILLSRLNGDSDYYDNYEERLQIINKYRLQEKFNLEKRIGNYNFFTFQN